MSAHHHRPASARTKARTQQGLYGSILAEFNGKWDAVPEASRNIARATSGIAADSTEETAVLKACADSSEHAKQLLPQLPPTLSAALAGPPMPTSARKQRNGDERPAGSLRSPKTVATSRIRQYIRSGTAGGGSQVNPAASGSGGGGGGSAAAAGISLQRVINEVQLRIPPLKRMMQQHGADLSDAETQVQCFTDVFGIIDETGDRSVSAEQIVAFGRKIGGSCARLLSHANFPRDRHVINKTEFLAVLFPNLAGLQSSQGIASARKPQPPSSALRKKSAATGPARFASSASRHPAESFSGATVSLSGGDFASAGSGTLTTSPQHFNWRTGWHPDDLAAFERIFALCDPQKTGSISLPALQAICPPDAFDSQQGGKFSTRALFQKYDANGDGLLSIAELAAMLKPAFEVARTRAEEPPLRLYFQHLDVPW